ncbi:MAG: dihydrofolate reductase [Bacteroidales bacterium]|nr:dihydrofolate reductase [Bacteroidales bacterium]
MYHQPQTNISIIVALAQNYAIGKNNDLLWHISDDMRHFKQLTTGHPVIMGRRTFESLPKRPLPNRRNIVVTHNHDFACEGAETMHSVNAVLDAVRYEEEAFVIGGAEIYRLFLPFAKRLYLTWVYADFDADVYFPTIDMSTFRQINITPRMHDEKSGLEYAFAELDRIYLPAWK